MNKTTLTLFPSNWLYNAGVIGLLRVLGKLEMDSANFIDSEGKVIVNLSELLSKYTEIGHENEKFKMPLIALHWVLESWEQLTEKQASSEAEKIKEVWGKLFNVWYRGFFSADTRYLFRGSKRSKALIRQLVDFLESLSDVCESDNRCSFCLRKSNFTYKNKFTCEHSKILGASAGEKGVPNSFWNLNPDQSLHVCDFCSFVLLNHHLALTRLSDDSEIFINAPSFRVMYYLNKFAREVFGSLSSVEMRNKRNILAMSVIEYATKMKATLGVWTSMNIEVVSRRKDQIEFFSLPYEVIELLSDKRIASLLSEIGEFTILNCVLNQNFSRLMEIGYRLLRIGLKSFSERAMSEKDFVVQTLKLDKNRRNPARVAEQIFRLYALIEDKQKRREVYEHISFTRS